MSEQPTSQSQPQQGAQEPSSQPVDGSSPAVVAGPSTTTTTTTAAATSAPSPGLAPASASSQLTTMQAAVTLTSAQLLSYANKFGAEVGDMAPLIAYQQMEASAQRNTTIMGAMSQNWLLQNIAGGTLFPRSQVDGYRKLATVKRGAAVFSDSNSSGTLLVDTMSQARASDSDYLQREKAEGWPQWASRLASRCVVRPRQMEGRIQEIARKELIKHVEPAYYQLAGSAVEEHIRSMLTAMIELARRRADPRPQHIKFEVCRRPRDFASDLLQQQRQINKQAGQRLKEEQYWDKLTQTALEQNQTKLRAGAEIPPETIPKVHLKAPLPASSLKDDTVPLSSAPLRVTMLDAVRYCQLDPWLRKSHVGVSALARLGQMEHSRRVQDHLQQQKRVLDAEHKAAAAAAAGGRRDDAAARLPIGFISLSGAANAAAAAASSSSSSSSMGLSLRQ